jgi:hypothetical protein
MRYFHRTSLTPDAVLAEADQHFGLHFQTASTSQRSRTFEGSMGTVTVTVEAEGGHYTLVTLGTDQVGESEADKVAKRFLTVVHTKVDPAHQARGAY